MSQIIETEYIENAKCDQISYECSPADNGKYTLRAVIHVANEPLDQQRCRQEIEKHLTTLFDLMIEKLRLPVDQVKSLSLSATYIGQQSQVCSRNFVTEFPGYPNPLTQHLDAFCEANYISLSYELRPCEGPVVIQQLPLNYGDKYHNWNYFKGRYTLTRSHVLEIFDETLSRGIILPMQSLARSIYDACWTLRHSGYLAYIYTGEHPHRIVIEKCSEVYYWWENDRYFREGIRQIESQDVSRELLHALQNRQGHTDFGRTRKIRP